MNYLIVISPLQGGNIMKSLLLELNKKLLRTLFKSPFTDGGLSQYINDLKEQF
jgi:hypothetical protein